jgi:predicted cobalt transporter CbtA
LSKEEFFVDTRIVSESDEKTENGHVSTAEDKPKVVDDVNTEEAQNEVRSEVFERLYTTLHTTLITKLGSALAGQVKLANMNKMRRPIMNINWSKYLLLYGTDVIYKKGK